MKKRRPKVKTVTPLPAVEMEIQPSAALDMPACTLTLTVIVTEDGRPLVTAAYLTVATPTSDTLRSEPCDDGLVVLDYDSETGDLCGFELLAYKDLVDFKELCKRIVSDEHAQQRLLLAATKTLIEWGLLQVHLDATHNLAAKVEGLDIVRDFDAVMRSYIKARRAFEKRHDGWRIPAHLLPTSANLQAAARHA